MPGSHEKPVTGRQRRTVGSATKLAPIPKGSTLRKRPLIRRPAPASSKNRIIYVSSSTPFMSAVKRVRKQLERSLRAGGSSQAARKNASLHARIEGLKRDVERGGGGGDEAGGGGGATVTLMGTGKAVEKTLSLASWFEQQPDCAVAVRTRTVATVDDLTADGGGGPEAATVEQGEEDETRLRRLSCLEVIVSLK
ncbi:Ribonuclease P/MRP, subunit POP7 [Cordyceps fumosorosea ARSEF 2679]|uniref:Ribonuclease P/MRP, subunit POP7 n=1 Tax=Cordyceps fumosorosea (strain ARSEF 2679) TaxID=1081104 RepID=A0A167TJH1_CORFA|nr:Ribonuclease P/MRP, subunit POP7 [Cordyceps fumosorosea ARSEF 2679]OAA60661.1 Ribonuclease P/MRP, subunit POP7 [Cordyceps fumosorosea ARSEF 2679]